MALEFYISWCAHTMLVHCVKKKIEKDVSTKLGVWVEVTHSIRLGLSSALQYLVL